MLAKILVGAALVLFLMTQTAFIIPEWEQAVVLQFGSLVRVIKDPGLYFKYPMIQDLFRFEKRILVTDARPAEYITLDKKRLTVDTVSRWKIVDPLAFFQTVEDYRGAVDRLNNVIVTRLREEIAKHNFKEFIREEREKIMDLVTQDTADAAKRFGIQVVDVRIKRVDLPEEVQASVFERMKAERGRIAKRYRAEGEEKAREVRAEAEKEQKVILAEAYRTSETLMGEGDAEAAAIYAESYGKDEQFYSFLRHLEVYEKAFKSGTTLLLRPDSELLRFMESPAAEKNISPATGK
jgi:membrane protease subunit HflC